MAVFAQRSLRESQGILGDLRGSKGATLGKVGVLSVYLSIYLSFSLRSLSLFLSLHMFSFLLRIHVYVLSLYMSLSPDGASLAALRSALRASFSDVHE